LRSSGYSQEGGVFVSKRTERVLHAIATVLLLTGSAMVVLGRSATIAFGAIASGLALTVVLAVERRKREALRP
jgi:hypothetical protein